MDDFKDFEQEVTPRNLRKLADSELPFFEDIPEVSVPGVISSQTFQAASICTLKGQNMLHGVKNVVPASIETKENRSQGHHFERKLLEKPHLWLSKLCAALEFEAFTDFKIYHCDIPMKDEYKVYLEKSKIHTKKIFSDHLLNLPNQPAIFWQATLGAKGGGQDGRADFIIYTGTKGQWVVADIKRSEECRTTFGIQLYFYRDLLADLIADIFSMEKQRVLKEDILPVGAIIHYARGYAWSSKAPIWDQTACMKNLKVTLMELDLLEREFVDLYESLLGADNANGPNMNNCQFSNHCNECEYRSRCYTHLFLGAHTDLSMVPMDGSVLEELKSMGITTAEDLAVMDPNNPIINDILENSERVHTFFKKSKIVSEIKGFSHWVYKKEWDAKLWFFVNHKDHDEDNILWRSPEGFDKVEIDEIPEVVVVLTELERKEAHFHMQKKFGNKSIIGVEYITLLDDLRNKVHIPLPSYSLSALSRFFSLISAGEKPNKILKHWFQQDGKEYNEYLRWEKKLSDKQERMLCAQNIIQGLKKLSELLHESF